MKKNVFVRAFQCIPVIIIIVSWLSCWSPFAPVTHIGQDVISGIDSNVTNLNAGFKVVNGMNLTVNGARSVVSPGTDTTVSRTKSGDYVGLYEAGRFGDDSAAMYAEFRMTQSDLINYRSVCGDTADSIYLQLYYDTAMNDKTISTPYTIQVFASERKFFPNVSNEPAIVDSGPPLFTVSRTHAVPDSFFIPLGPEMLSRFNRAIADTSATRYVSRIDSDTTFIYDTSKKYIGAVSVHASGGGILRFARQPVFQIANRTNCTDTILHRFVVSSSYYDVCMSEINTIPSDSLMTSWQANRYIEIPISLAPLWDSAKTKEGQFKIVQTASCSLYTSNSLFEQINPSDTIDSVRTIVYGLLDHTISDAKFHSTGAYDSLNSILGTGRVALDTVHRGSSGMRLTMTPFLQSLADENPRPQKAYLYIFERIDSRLSRIVFGKVSTIKFSALFSNPHQ